RGGELHLPHRSSSSRMAVVVRRRSPATSRVRRLAKFCPGYPPCTPREGDRMATVEQSIEVEAPLRTAYNQWTQFEEFPQFMEGVQEVRQLDDTHLFWRADIAGKTAEWEAEIYEQIPDSRIAWRSTSGAPNAGAVSFQSVSPN